jgi:hypothetical protein
MSTVPARLTDDPDQAEVIGDLKRSTGAKLTDPFGADDRILAIEGVDVVLDAVGPVGPGDDWPATIVADRPHRRRRPYRVREGQQLAGD